MILKLIIYFLKIILYGSIISFKYDVIVPGKRHRTIGTKKKTNECNKKNEVVRTYGTWVTYRSFTSL